MSFFEKFRLNKQKGPVLNTRPDLKYPYPRVIASEGQTPAHVPHSVHASASIL